jgi:hypothetical protein
MEVRRWRASWTAAATRRLLQRSCGRRWSGIAQPRRSQLMTYEAVVLPWRSWVAVTGRVSVAVQTTGWKICLTVPRRQRTTLEFQQMRSLQKFASVHAGIQNYSGMER